MNDLMKNSTSAKFLDNVDPNLLNPYTKLKSNHKIKRDIEDDVLRLTEPVNMKTKRDSIFKKLKPKSRRHDMSIIGNIGNIQEIIKNKTLHDLGEIKDPPIEIPGKHRTNKKSRTKKFSGFPVLNGLDLSDDSFRFSNLFKFKEK
jgi:hypothetical protein